MSFSNGSYFLIQLGISFYSPYSLTIIPFLSSCICQLCIKMSCFNVENRLSHLELWSWRSWSMPVVCRSSGTFKASCASFIACCSSASRFVIGTKKINRVYFSGCVWIDFLVVGAQIVTQYLIVRICNDQKTISNRKQDKFYNLDNVFAHCGLLTRNCCCSCLNDFRSIPTMLVGLHHPTMLVGLHHIL